MFFDVSAILTLPDNYQKLLAADTERLMTRKTVMEPQGPALRQGKSQGRVRS
jgi:hypothetical protein